MTSEPASPEIKALSGRSTKLFLLIFFATIFGFSWWMTKGNQAGLDELRIKGSAKQAFYQCQGIVSGDTLLVVPSARQGDSFIRRFFKKLKGLEDTIVESDPPREVKVIGIQAPPMKPGPEADFFAKQVGIDVETLLSPRSVTKKHYGEIARDALKVYIYKQNIRLDFPDPDQPRAHAVISNVDLGMVVLQHGQAIALDEEHEYTEMYREFQADAKRQLLGIWDK